MQISYMMMAAHSIRAITAANNTPKKAPTLVQR